MGMCDGEAVVRKWEEGNECSDSLRGNACSNGDFQRGGFRYTPAHARGRSPDPLAVGQPCGRRAPGLRSRHPHHASRGQLVKKRDANLYTKLNPPTVSLQGHVTPASVARKWARVRAIPWDCLPAGARGARGRVGSGIRQLSLSMSEPPSGGLSWASGARCRCARRIRSNRRSSGGGETRTAPSVRSTMVQGVSLDSPCPQCTAPFEPLQP